LIEKIFSKEFVAGFQFSYQIDVGKIGEFVYVCFW